MQEDVGGIGSSLVGTVVRRQDIDTIAVFVQNVRGCRRD